MKHIVIFATIICAFAIVGCQSKKEPAEQKQSTEAAAPAEKEPDFIVVQHILIGFQGSIPGKPISRTKADAEKLAGDVFKRAKAGEDYDALVKEYTDDSAPGIYKMNNFGLPADPAKQIFARANMVAAFGNTGFPLKVGEIGLAEYDARTSPYGWHIIKRLQ